MFGLENTGSALETIAHIIQVALTPVTPAVRHRHPP
jgi:hypothetical protein